MYMPFTPISVMPPPCLHGYLIPGQFQTLSRNTSHTTGESRDRLLLPGDFFGLEGCAGQPCYTHSVKALGEVEVYRMPTATAMRLFCRDGWGPVHSQLLQMFVPILENTTLHQVQSGALVRELLRMQVAACALEQNLDQFRRQEAQLRRQHRAAVQTHH